MLEGHRRTTSDEEAFYCKEFIPNIAGTYSGTLAVFGGGKSMWEDYARFKEINGKLPYESMATNISAMFVIELKHIYSLHFKQISAIKKWRNAEYAEENNPKRPIYHGGRHWEGIDHIWFPAGWASTSGFTMLVIGHLLGYRKFILIGVPMDGSGYFYKPTVNKTFGDDQRFKEISEIKKRIPEVRSMSGRTKDILGEPTAEWLK